VVERLPRKRKVLGSVPSSEKKEAKKKKNRQFIVEINMLHISYLFILTTFKLL